MSEKPVVFITDDNFTVPTMVALSSLIKNKDKNSQYKIFVVGVSLSDANKKKILNNFPQVKIVLPDMSYDNANLTHPYVSKAALFKFSLAEIFSQYDRILYLDSDIIINKDINDIFEYCTDNFLAAVVKDMVGTVKNLDNEKVKTKNYFNTGVMLLNLKKMREYNASLRLQEAKQFFDSVYSDQEIFNIVFKDNVIYIHPDYNYMSTNSLFSQKSVKSFYGVDEINPAILHLTDFIKPWIYKNAPYAKKWFTYFKALPFAEDTPLLKTMPKKTWKQKIGIRWCIDLGLLRLSYLKGPADFKVKLKITEDYDYFLNP